MSYSEWDKVTLGEVCDIFDNLRKPLSTMKRLQIQGKYPYYGAASAIDFINDYIFDGHYILIAEDGSVMDSSGAPVIQNVKGKFWVSNHSHVLKGNDRILTDYIFYHLRSIKIKPYLTGSVQLKLNQSNLKSIEIKLPALPKQKAIANILSSLDDKIELNNKINKNLEEMAQALYKQWFVDFEFPNEDGEPYKSSGGEMIESELGLIPKGWVVDSLTNIANFKNGLAVKKYAPSKDEKSIPVLKIKELRNGDCDENSDRVTIDFPEDYIIQNGDLIFSWSGTLMVDFWTGKVAGLNQHLFKVDSEKFDRWFYYYWTSFHLAKFQNIASSMATTMGHIKRSDLNKSKVLVPTQNILDKGLDLFEPILMKIIVNRNQNNKLKKTRDTLLPKLMSGEIEVPI